MKDTKLMKLALNTLIISLVAQISVGCASIKETESVNFTSSFQCLTLTKIMKEKNNIEILVDLNYSSDREIDNTECRALFQSESAKPKIKFIFMKIDPVAMGRVASTCVRSSLVPIEQFLISHNWVIDPSYANYILLRNKCDVIKLLSDKKTEISERDIESIVYLQNKFAQHFVLNDERQFNPKNNDARDIILPKFIYKTKQLPAISGEFFKVTIQTAFYMGAIVDSDSSEVYCATINDLSDGEVPMLIDTLSACLFDLQYSA